MEFDSRIVDYRDDRYVISCQEDGYDRYSLIIDQFDDLTQEWVNVYQQDNLTERMAERRYKSDNTIKNMYLPLKYSK